MGSLSIYSALKKYKTWSEFDARSVFDFKKVEKLNPKGNSYRPKRYTMELSVKAIEVIPDEAWQCIESVSQSCDGFIIKTVSKLKANDALAKWLGMDKPKSQLQKAVNLYFDSDDMKV